MNAENSVNGRVKYYLAWLKWDGVSRIHTLLHDYLGAPHNYYSRYAAIRALIAAVDRAFDPGCAIDHALVLTGPKGCGKSDFIKKLSKGWYSDNVKVGKDLQDLRVLQSAWLVELSDFKAEDIKRFTRQKQDRYKNSEGSEIRYYDRQFVPIITTNQTCDYFANTALNRLFFSVECGTKSSELPELTEEIVDQIWAEAVESRRQFYA